MKILTDKQYRDLINEPLVYKNLWEKSKEELKEAKDLKAILTKISGTTINGLDFAASGGSWSFSFDDTVAKYVEDLFGGKVIKQEANKAIIISKDGEVKTGLTKQKTDKGYQYKLVRE